MGVHAKGYSRNKIESSGSAYLYVNIEPLSVEDHRPEGNTAVQSRHIHKDFCDRSNTVIGFKKASYFCNQQSQK